MGKSYLAQLPSSPWLGPTGVGRPSWAWHWLLGSQPSVQRTLLLTPGSFLSFWGTGTMRLLLWRTTEQKTTAFFWALKIACSSQFLHLSWEKLRINTVKSFSVASDMSSCQ
jgi:hypothetical protein